MAFTVSATTAAPGNIVTATVANGPGNATDWVALFPANGSTWLDWKFLNGARAAPAAGLSDATVAFTMPTVPGTYTLRMYANDTWTVLATSPTITVAGVTFSVSATTVAPGGTVTATIGNGPANAKDWVGLYAVGSAAEVDWKFLNGSRTAPAAGVADATLSFTLPTTPGTYVLRLYRDDTYTLLATSRDHDGGGTEPDLHAQRDNGRARRHRLGDNRRRSGQRGRIGWRSMPSAARLSSTGSF